MIIAYVGSGGKTSRLREDAARWRELGKKVFVTTTTHMSIETDTLLTDDPQTIIQTLERTGYVMAGISEGRKITALSRETYEAVCPHADVVLVEADGSRQLPLKFPNRTEPVIPDNVDEIVVICGLNALERRAEEVCHRPELAVDCLGISGSTPITPVHIQKLVTEGYLRPLRQQFPEKTVSLLPRHDGSLYQRAVAAMLQWELDVSSLRKEWFSPQPRLIICGGGHVAKETAALAAHLDFSIKVIDDRPELLTAERFPNAEEIICDSYDNLEQHLESGACYVVVTPNHKADYRCVASILSTEYAYLGMIGSKKKVAGTVEKLRTEGFSEAQIETLFAPIGLPIGAVTPAEIAFSILGQIIQEKNKHHAASADRALLETQAQGVLCIITHKNGSTPRGVGSMMLVGQDRVLGSIGGGESEYLAIRHARENLSPSVQTFRLNNQGEDGLDMVCGGTIQVLFLPL